MLTGHSIAAVILAVVLLATLVFAYWPGVARGFLRGGQFRRPWSREKVRGQLFRLGSRAGVAGDEPAAKLLERAAFALGQGPEAERTLATITALPEVWTAGAEDLREVDRLELQRRDKLDRQSGRRPGESPVFRDGEFVGWLQGRGIDKDPEGTVLAWNGGVQMIRRRTWETSASDDELVSLPPNVFRLAIVALALALTAGLLSPVAAYAAGRTYHPEALAWVAAEPPGSAEVPTHIRIEGEVAYVAHEADGDVHVRLCHNGRCMVAECVPGVPVTDVSPGYPGGSYIFRETSLEVCRRLASLGRRIAVWGISRYDGAPGHGEQAEGAAGRRGHWEVHPVEGIEVLP